MQVRSEYGKIRIQIMSYLESNYEKGNVSDMSEDKEKVEGEVEGSECLTDGGCASGALIILILFFSLPFILVGGNSPNGPYFGIPYHFVLDTVYESLGNYSQNNDGNYPGENWFDVLYPSGNFEEYGLSKYCGVVLNPDALELGDGSPDDLVLGFRSNEDDWGKVGVYDPEKFGGRAVLVCLFSDGEIQRVSRSHIKYLRWSEDGFERPKLDTAGLYGIIGAIGGAVLVIVVVFFKYFLKSLHVVVLIAVFAYMPSSLFGAMGASLYLPLLDYTYHEYVEYICWLGPVVAIGYVPLMKYLRVRYRYFNCTYPVVLCGIVTGVICAVLTHVILRYLYMEESFNPMVGGIPFGMWSGAILGVVTSALIGKKDTRRK